jgi:hypothetical protein
MTQQLTRLLAIRPSLKNAILTALSSVEIFHYGTSNCAIFDFRQSIVKPFCQAQPWLSLPASLPRLQPSFQHEINRR